MGETLLTRRCEFSECRSYRYTLWREWAIEDLFAECSADTQAHTYLLVIGLNPSTADETKDDPTIRREIDFAKRWGFGALCKVNLFAWRDTKPAKMKKVIDPIGPENDHWIRRCAAGAGMILAGWGTNGSFRGRDKEVRKLLEDRTIYCLRKNDDGSPEHPLYIPKMILPSPL